MFYINNNLSLNVKYKQQEGIILPFVLLTIAAISLIAISAYNALSRSSQYMRQLKDNATHQLALTTAEAETIYHFVSATGDDKGMRLGNPNDTSDASIFGGATEETSPEDIWSALGGIRLSNRNDTDILVSYRDASGLAPINKLEEEELAKLLTYTGFAPQDSNKLAAELVDFRDIDIERRFQGAERSDYRIYQKAPPTNSPLRTIPEISRLLSIPPDLGNEYWSNFIDIATTSTDKTDVNTTFAEQKLIKALGLDQTEFGLDELSLIAQSGTKPSNRARFLLTIGQRNSNINGRTRIIEIEKSVNDISKPFRRYQINEKARSTIVPTNTLQETNTGRGDEDEVQDNVDQVNTNTEAIPNQLDPTQTEPNQNDTQNRDENETSDTPSGDVLNAYKLIIETVSQSN